MACRPFCLFLDSALRDPARGRFSFLAADPFDVLIVPADGRDGLAALEDVLCRYAVPTVPGLPPFQGGAAGLFGYDLSRSLERLPAARWDEFQTPAMAVGFYDVVVAFDHEIGKAWIISQGFPEREPARRRRRAVERIAQVRDWLAAPLQSLRPPCGASLSACDLSPQYALEEMAGVTSNFSRDGYLAAVERARDFIYAGDIFQVNLSQRLLTPAWDDSTALYRRLRRRNAAPFAGYFDVGDLQILSASPERFLRVVDGEVETRPIKGTRPRTGDRDVDRASEADLVRSEKDRAENVMIVDLLRNDLSRVCTADSVRVEQLCAVEAYPFLWHLVSSVQGRLRDGASPIALVRASFPGGSITGAPKIRAMEIIAELEPTARGAYCGSLGYLGFDGTMDLSILIRTITAGRGWWQFPVGGGIVAPSRPEDEYAETLHKAKGLLRALRP